MADFSVASILESISGINAESSENKNIINETYDSLANLKANEALLMQQGARDAELVNKTAGLGELDRQAQNDKALSQLNYEEIMGRFAPSLLQEFDAIQQMDAAIAEKESVGLFDNPLKFIANQFTLQDDLVKRNQVADSLNQKASMLKSVNDLAQEAAATSLATRKLVTEASVEASARMAGLEYLNKANNAQIEAGTLNLDRLQRLQGLNERGLNALMSGRQVILGEEDRAMKIAEFNANQAERKIRLAEFQKQKAAESKEAEAELKLVEVYNVGARKVGKRPIQNVEDFKLMTRTANSKAMAESLIDLGYQQISTGSVRLGGTPAQSAELLMQTNGRLAPTQQKLENLIVGTAIAVKSGEVSKGIDLKNPTLVRDTTNKNINAAVDRFSSDVMRDKGDNIYAPPTVNSIVTAVPVIANDSFYKKVLAPELAVIGTKELDPQLLMERAVTGIFSGEVKYNEALAGIKKLTTAAIALNNAENNYEAVGLPEQTSFKTKIKTAPNNRFMTGDVNLDFTDDAAMALTFNRMLVQEKQRLLLQGNVGAANAVSGFNAPLPDISGRLPSLPTVTSKPNSPATQSYIAEQQAASERLAKFFGGK